MEAIALCAVVSRLSQSRPTDVGVLPDLTLPEWQRFRLLHCTHHAKQIRARLAA
jgi:hypothetical protein